MVPQISKKFQINDYSNVMTYDTHVLRFKIY